MLRADFPPFGSKSAHLSAKLPTLQLTFAPNLVMSPAKCWDLQPCPLPLDIAESCHTFCRGNEKPLIGSTGQFIKFCIPETLSVSFAQKRVLIWLYKGFDGTFPLCGKTYGTIWQCPRFLHDFGEAWYCLYCMLHADKQ